MKLKPPGAEVAAGVVTEGAPNVNGAGDALPAAGLAAAPPKEKPDEADWPNDGAVGVDWPNAGEGVADEPPKPVEAGAGADDPNVNGAGADDGAAEPKGEELAAPPPNMDPPPNAGAAGLGAAPPKMGGGADEEGALDPNAGAGRSGEDSIMADSPWLKPDAPIPLAIALGAGVAPNENDGVDVGAAGLLPKEKPFEAGAGAGVAAEPKGLLAGGAGDDSFAAAAGAPNENGFDAVAGAAAGAGEASFFSAAAPPNVNDGVVDAPKDDAPPPNAGAGGAAGLAG